MGGNKGFAAADVLPRCEELKYTCATVHTVSLKDHLTQKRSEIRKIRNQKKFEKSEKIRKKSEKIKNQKKSKIRKKSEKSEKNQKKSEKS